MKLVSFIYKDAVKAGRLDNEIITLFGSGNAIPADMLSLLSLGPEGLAAASEVVGECVRLSDVNLLAPLPRPPKLLGIGLNYAAHVAEAGGKPEADTPVQFWFNKQQSSLTGPYDPIVRPTVSKYLDYECELGVVIGQRCRHVQHDQALSVIAGYTIINDGSVRDWQFKSPTTMMGKSFDRTSPMGPAIVTGDEISDPHNLSLQCWVNDELRQSANTTDMIHSIADQIVELSTVFTLEPGDVIATGTPDGVGAAMDPRQFLKPGDVVRMTIESIGTIENKVVDETDQENHA